MCSKHPAARPLASAGMGFCAGAFIKCWAGDAADTIGKSHAAPRTTWPPPGSARRSRPAEDLSRDERERGGLEGDSHKPRWASGDKSLVREAVALPRALFYV